MEERRGRTLIYEVRVPEPSLHARANAVFCTLTLIFSPYKDWGAGRSKLKFRRMGNSPKATTTVSGYDRLGTRVSTTGKCGPDTRVRGGAVAALARAGTSPITGLVAGTCRLPA